MSKDYGIRVSKPGYSVLTGTDPQMVMSSKFDNLKIHSRGSGTIYDSTGRTKTIAHGLGYVPVFLFHSQGDAFYSNAFTDMSGKYMIAPIQLEASDIGSPYHYYNRSTICWADSTNIYIKVQDDFGYNFAFGGNETDNFGEDGDFYLTGWFGVGRETDGSPTYKGALRFNDVNTSGSVYKASIGIYVAYAGGVTTPVKTWGIDEDNTGGFGSHPFSRDRTTAYVANTKDSGLGVGSTWAYDVTSIFNEILGRAGWSSGNHMAFVMEDNGSTVNATYFETTVNYNDGFPFYTPRTYLKWLSSNTLTNYRYTIFKNKLST